MLYNQIPKHIFKNKRFFTSINYDGTPTPIVKSTTSIFKDSYLKNIPTVELEYDHYKTNLPNSNNPIIFIHGLFGSKLNNRSVSKQLSKLLNRDVYNIDLRNHGDSPHIERHDYPSMSQDLENFIVEKGLIDPILIGHSMGAKVSMATCLRSSNLISMLISVDNAPLDTTNSINISKYSNYIKKLKEITLDENIHTLKEADNKLSIVENSLPVRQFLLTNLKRVKNLKTNLDKFESRIPLDIMLKQLPNISLFPFDPNVSTFNKPSLFIRGSKSPYIADEFISSIAMFFPQFELKDVDAGHWLIAEKPKDFIDIVVEYIERKEDL